MSRLTQGSFGIVVGLALAVLFLGSGTAKADIVNGGFETGDFTGWSTLGNNSVVGALGNINPPQGSFQALVDNNAPSVSAASLAAFLGITSAQLQATIPSGNTPFDGSGIKQTVSVNAGDKLTFQWNFLTDEAIGDSTFNDTGFVTIVPSANPAQTLASTLSSGFISGDSSGFGMQTGFNTFSFTFPTSGTFTIGVGAVNVSDANVPSALLVDNFAITTTTVVPEPASITVLGAGLLGMLGYGLRRRKPVA
jgi:hypothetical protein